MKGVIWSLFFFFFQTWLNRLLGIQKTALNESGFTFMEAAEQGARRLLIFAFKALAAGIAGLIGLYYVLATLREFLERDMGWDPAGVTGLLAVIFLAAAGTILLYSGPKSVLAKPERPLPPAIGSEAALEL